MTIGSLFSGVGGLDLGLEWAGFGPVLWQVERDERCRRVLEKYWPETKRYTEADSVGKHNLEPVDLICGGPPCQPFSCAGKRRGAEDDRDQWPNMLRVVGELRPSLVVAENVYNLKSMGKSRTITRMATGRIVRTPDYDSLETILTYEERMYLYGLLEDFAKIGYWTLPLAIPAVAVDARHIRMRIWIVAYTGQLPRRDIRINKTGQDASGKRTTDNHEIIGSGRESAIMADTEVDCIGAGLCEDEQREKRRGRSGNRCGTGRNHRIPEPGLGECINGISTFLDGDRINAKSEKERPEEVLSVLRETAQKEALQWDSGEQQCLFEKEILRPRLHGRRICQRCAIRFGLIETIHEIPWETLRNMWGYTSHSSSSQRRKSFEQLKREYPDLMRALSCHPTPPCQTCWEDDAWEAGIPRTIADMPDRRARLEELGNAVVPIEVMSIGEIIRDWMKTL